MSIANEIIRRSLRPLDEHFDPTAFEARAKDHYERSFTLALVASASRSTGLVFLKHPPDAGPYVFRHDVEVGWSASFRDSIAGMRLAPGYSFLTADQVKLALQEARLRLFKASNNEAVEA